MCLTLESYFIRLKSVLTVAYLEVALPDKAWPSEELKQNSEKRYNFVTCGLKNLGNSIPTLIL